MNEIEKMYKNAKVKPVCDGLDCWACVAKCNNGKYPEFTAEKQLKLIDWFIRNEADIRIIFDCEDELYYFQTELMETVSSKSFIEVLANLINIYFEDFTDGEKEEIKEILK